MIDIDMESKDSAAGWTPPDNDKAGIIRCGTPQDYISLEVDQGIVWIRLEREPRGEDMRLCIERAFALGLIGTGRRVVVDLRRFQGSVDWPSIYAVAKMAPWGERGASRVAYIARHQATGVLLRLFGDLFPRASHRLFLDPEPALAWLRE